MTAVKVGENVLRQLKWNGERYDFIGDVHGCKKTLDALFVKLGYAWRGNVWVHPHGRIPVFLGDLIDKGPDSYGVLKLALRMVFRNKALYVPGNHCEKLYRFIKGGGTNLSVQLQKTIAQIKGSIDGKALMRDFASFMSKVKTHLVLDGGNVVAVHASVTKDTVGVYNKETYRMNLFGFVNQSVLNQNGVPMRIPTMDMYVGDKLVIHGHIKMREPRYGNNVLNIDTSCGKMGGKLTSYRYPEGNLVSQEVIDIICKSIKDIEENGKEQVG